MLSEHQKISEQLFENAFPADDLFGSLSPEAEKKLRAVKQTRQFAKDEIIFADGQMPRAIYRLAEGKAGIFRDAAKPVRPVGKNEILGLTEAVSNLPYEMSVKAVTPCSFEYIRREDFMNFLQTEPEICFRLLRMLGTNLQKIFRLFH